MRDMIRLRSASAGIARADQQLEMAIVLLAVLSLLSREARDRAQQLRVGDRTSVVLD